MYRRDLSSFSVYSDVAKIAGRTRPIIHPFIHFKPRYEGNAIHAARGERGAKGRDLRAIVRDARDGSGCSRWFGMLAILGTLAVFRLHPVVSTCPIQNNHIIPRPNRQRDLRQKRLNSPVRFDPFITILIDHFRTPLLAI
jgi:hypothetical protein